MGARAEPDSGREGAVDDQHNRGSRDSSTRGSQLYQRWLELMAMPT